MLGALWKLIPTKPACGYENPELIETIFQKTREYSPTEPWLEMAGISSVLDFGGACGRHYKEAVTASPMVRWAVVDTPAMVARAKEMETDHLKFFADIDAAASWLGPIEVMHSNGALQYTERPMDSLKKLCALRASSMWWFRVSTGDGTRATQTSMLSDNGPGPSKFTLKKVSYERTMIVEQEFLKAHVEYNLVDRGSDWFKFLLRK